MKQDQKSTRFVKVIMNSRGQAVVEYILLAVIVVSLMIGMKNVFGTINDGVNRYIGDYIVCLMEYGELPTLGIQEAGLKKHVSGAGKTCDKNFAAYSFNDGRPYSGAGSGGSGRAGGSGSSGGSNANTGRDRNGTDPNAGGQASNNTNASGENGDDGDDATGAGGFGRGGRSGAKGAKTKSPVTQAGPGFGTLDGGYDDAQKIRVLDDDESEAARKKKDRNNRSRNLSSRILSPGAYRAVTGRMAQEIEKQRPSRVTRRPTSTVKTILSGESRFGPYKKNITPPPVKKAEEMKEDNSSFSFGNIMRWLLIAAMVLAIVVFFGGQVMNYSNSKD